MYLTIEETAEYLELHVSEIHRLVQQKQVRFVQVEGETLLYKEQFNLFLQEREKQKAAFEDYLNAPIPEDIDIKDED